MRKKLSIVIAILMALSFISFKGLKAEEADNKPFRIFVDNKEVAFDNSLGYPFAESERTFVPIRFIGNNLGFTSNWDQGTQTATISNGTTVMKLSLNSTTAEINGVKKAIDPSGNIKTEVRNERIYVPLRFVSENMGVRVEYEWTETAHIIKLFRNEYSKTDETQTKKPFNPGFEDWPREIVGAQIQMDKAKMGALLRVGEQVGTDIYGALGRVGKNNRMTLTGPNVSANWVPIELGVVAKNPLIHEGSISHFVLSKQNAKQLLNKGDDWTIRIQLIDDRYLPYDRWEIKDSNGNWSTLRGPISDENTMKLADLARISLESNGKKGVGEFYFWSDTSMAPVWQGRLRFKGTDTIPSPPMGDKIRYRATVRQGDEEHVFEFNSRYQWAANFDFLNEIKRQIPDEEKAKREMKSIFDNLDQIKCFKGEDKNPTCSALVEDVVQVK